MKHAVMEDDWGQEDRAEEQEDEVIDCDVIDVPRPPPPLSRTTQGNSKLLLLQISSTKYPEYLRGWSV